jgi:hypothetical protein
MAKTGKRELKVILNITLVELTGQRSNEFEGDMSRILKTHVASKILI